MKASAFEYERADDAAHAVRLLRDARGYAKPIAGAQSLGPMMNFRLAAPDVLVDVRTCEDMRTVYDEGDAFVYGGAITHAQIEDGAVPDATNGWLAKSARAIAYRAVRNRGTIGGSLAHADPAADWLTILLALEAQVITLDTDGERASYLRDFVSAPFTTRLAKDAVLTGVRVAKRSKKARFGIAKFAVKQGEFAQALCAVAVDPERDETRLVLGAIERVPVVWEGLNAGVIARDAAHTMVAERVPGLDVAKQRLYAVAIERATRNCYETKA